MFIPQNSNFPNLIFPKLGLREEVQISNFSQIQKSPKHPGEGGGQENYGLFPLFGAFFNSEAPLKFTELAWAWFWADLGNALLTGLNKFIMIITWVCIKTRH